MSSSDDEKSNSNFFKYRNKLDDYKLKDPSQTIIPKFKHSINSNIKKSDFMEHKYSTQGLFNIPNLIKKFKWKKITDNLNIEKEDEAIKFLEIMLKIYLKNSIQKLIEINRRRSYSKDLPNFREKLKKIPIKTINYKNEIQKDGSGKLIFYPYKTFNIFYKEDIQTKLNLLEEYESVKRSMGKEKKVEISKNIKKDSESEDSKEESKTTFQIYNTNDVTKNCRKFTLNNKRKITIKDFISFLECNVKTPMHRLLLQRAFVEMTLPKNNNINNNNKHSYEKEKEIEKDKDKVINIGDFIKKKEFI